MALKLQPSSAASACASMASSAVTAATTSTGRHHHHEPPCNAAVMGARQRRRCPPNPRDPPSRPPNSTPWCLVQAIATGFHRFLARFSGRRRIHLYHHKYPPPWAFIVAILVSSLISIVEGCSSRTTPKPRPPAAPTPRPNITFHTYECPPEYAAWYCLNGATCFTVKIGNSLIYNCECVESFVGPRCEYKDLDGSYLPSQRKYMLETASIAGGATIAVLSVVMICAAAYLHYRRKAKRARAAQGGDCVDSAPRRHQPTFGTRWRTTSNGGGGGPPRPGHPHHSFPPPTTTQTGAAVEQDRGGGDTPGPGSAACKAEELRQVTALLPPPPSVAPPPDAAAAAGEP